VGHLEELLDLLVELAGPLEILLGEPELLEFAVEFGPLSAGFFGQDPEHDL
jgi:hypothetical protein